MRRPRPVRLSVAVALIALGVLFACDSGSDDAPAPPPGPCRSGTAMERVPVPEDALKPEPGTGVLKPVGPGTAAGLVLCYGASKSIFHDGTRTSAADVLYAYAVAYRWGAEGAPGAKGYDPAIDRSTALLRRRLAGFRVVGIDKSSKSIRIGDFAFVRELVLVEVYVNETSAGSGGADAVAPPWSSVPWHVLALMEEAVGRGWAAFSADAAARAGVPWLDLARQPALTEKLAALVAAFARDGFVPRPLAAMVSADQARERWAALKAFFDKHGHFLVTNGPYRLKSWGDEATVLEVVRDISYPLGVGSYDGYAIPRHAHITAVETAGAGLVLAVEVERVEKFMRSFKIVRQPLAGTGGEKPKREKVVAHYVVVGADGRVHLAGQGRPAGNSRFVLDLEGRLEPGDYTVLAAVELNGNTVGTDVRRIPYKVR